MGCEFRAELYLINGALKKFNWSIRSLRFPKQQKCIVNIKTFWHSCTFFKDSALCNHTCTCIPAVLWPKVLRKGLSSAHTYFGLRRAAVPLSRDLTSSYSTSSRSMNARHQSRSVSNAFLRFQWLLKMEFTSKIVLKSFEVHLVMRSTFQPKQKLLYYQHTGQQHSDCSVICLSFAHLLPDSIKIHQHFPL